MSDLEKLFEHAPEGATEIAVFPDGELRYATEGKTWYAPRWIARPHKWQTIATRPQPGQPRKTVEDAVEWNESVGLGDEWGHEDCDVIIIYRDGFAYSDSRATSKEIACTREEFEACVAAKAKSEPEWTHTYFNIRCRIADLHPDEFGTVVIIKEEGDYSLAHPSKLKPIKPTISRDAKEQLEFYAQYRADKYGDHAMKSDLSDYIAEHEVVK
jgi:hypothetical protein